MHRHDVFVNDNVRTPCSLKMVSRRLSRRLYHNAEIGTANMRPPNATTRSWS